MAAPNPQLMPLLAALMLAHSQGGGNNRTLPIGRPDQQPYRALPVTPIRRRVSPIGIGPGGNTLPITRPDGSQRIRALAAMQLALNGGAGVSRPRFGNPRPPGYSIPQQPMY